MSDKLVWSSNGTHDHLRGLSREDKLANLPDYGYEADMIADMDDDGLDDLINTSDDLWQLDSEYFEENIIPAINAQTEDGFVVVGDAEEPIMTDDLVGCCEALYNRDGQLVTDSGDVIYFIDEDGYKIPIDADQLDVIEESVSVNEAKTKDPETLEEELEQIEPLAEEYGFEFFSSMPFTNYEDDEQSLEYQYPEFFKICRSFFLEMGIVEDKHDIDALEDNWYSIDQHDWDVIIKVCKKLIAKPDKAIQFEKVYPDGFTDGLTGDEEKSNKSSKKKFKVTKPDYDVATKTSLDRSYEESYSRKRGKSLFESLRLNEADDEENKDQQQQNQGNVQKPQQAQQNNTQKPVQQNTQQKQGNINQKLSTEKSDKLKTGKEAKYIKAVDENPKAAAAKLKKLPYKQFVMYLKQDIKSQEFYNYLKDHYKDNDLGTFKKVEVTEENDIIIKELMPTQNNISMVKSLGDAKNWGPLVTDGIASGCFKDAINMGRILVYNKKYIIDGHHRWSKAYAINPEAKFPCVNIQGPQDLTPLDVLKGVQIAIAKKAKGIPGASVDTPNLLVKGSDKEAYDHVLKNLKDNILESEFKPNGYDTKEKVAGLIQKNVQQMAAAGCIQDAPDREVMPQTTEEPKEGKPGLKTKGVVNDIAAEGGLIDVTESLHRTNKLNEEFGEPTIFDKITQIGLQSYGVDESLNEDFEDEYDSDSPNINDELVFYNPDSDREASFKLVDIFDEDGYTIYKFEPLDDDAVDFAIEDGDNYIDGYYFADDETMFYNPHFNKTTGRLYLGDWEEAPEEERAEALGTLVNYTQTNESWGDEDVEPKKGTPLREDEEDDEQAAREEADYQAYLDAKEAGEFDNVEVDEALERSNNIKAYYRRMEGLDPEEEITELQESAFNSTSCYWHENPENLKNILLSK